MSAHVVSLCHLLPVICSVQLMKLKSSMTGAQKIAFDGRSAVVEYGSNVRHSDALGMQFIQHYVETVSVPEVYDVYYLHPCAKNKVGMTYIVSEWIFEECLSEVWADLASDIKDDIMEQLRSMLQTLRHLSPPDGFSYVGASGHLPYTDPVLFDQGPFLDVLAFNKALVDVARPLLSVVRRTLCRTDAYRIVFTHGDLHIPNILVSRQPGACHSWLDNRLRMQSMISFLWIPR
jgi:hypothetical protein